jgi:hypothetical protein
MELLDSSVLAFHGMLSGVMFLTFEGAQGVSIDVQKVQEETSYQVNVR